MNVEASGPRWYALYTCTRHEKKIAQELCRRGVENYLPTYSAWHNWTDRRVKVELPLFPGYTFVRIDMKERLRVLTVPGVVRLVGSGNIPAPLRDVEVEGIRRYLVGDGKAEPYDGLMEGARVCVTDGPLAGCEGVLLRRKNSLRLIVTLELIARSVAVEVAARDVAPLQASPILPSLEVPLCDSIENRHHVANQRNL